MKIIIISLLAATAFADRLENTYLPPGSARTAGGNGNFLNAPLGGQHQGSPSRNYGAPGFDQNGPSSEYGVPSAEYGVPNGQYSSGNNYNGAAGNYNGAAGNYNGVAGNYNSGAGHYSGASGHNAGGFGRFGGRAQSREAGAAIFKYNNENYGDGTYRFEYETENGISQQEQGEPKDTETNAVRGSYTYTGDDGQTYTVNYIADENGFQPFGEHIAQISQAVQTSLQKNAAEAQQGYQYNNGAQNGRGYQSGASNNNYNQATNRQYLAPSNGGYNQESGYQY